MKKIFICSNCAAQSPKWQGKCTGCGSWNTLQEELIQKGNKNKELSKNSITYSNKLKNVPIPINEITTGNTFRIKLPGKELNRVLGGGLVPGSIILVGGQPGIGKSTLLLQTALKAQKKILYVTGEESEEQIKMRADRISKEVQSCYIYTETDTQKIIKQAQDMNPEIIIIDSIQTVHSPFIDSSPGSISQVRECSHELQQFAKQANIPIFLIGHITKDGNLAGPKLLEHIVDVVLQFEGDQNYTYRIIRSLKNRFGSTDELGIYEMQSTGLREINNPSELLLSQTSDFLSGCAIAATVEGQRPLLIETQALVSNAIYGTPQRSATGFDNRRLGMLLAVLEKRCGFFLGSMDVFLNIAGGIKVSDPAIDLAIISAIISSFEDNSVQSNICFAGESGLTGEIRAISRLLQRIQEAERLGFERIFVPSIGLKGIKQSDFKIQIVPTKTVQELYQILFK